MSDFSAGWGNYLLKQFSEIPLPKMIDLMPQTIGWQCVFMIFIIVLLNKAFVIWHQYKQNLYRREAIYWLDSLPEFTDINAQSEYRKLPRLLRKTALYAYSRALVSPLGGISWIQWLNAQSDDKTTFSSNSLLLLQRLAYSPFDNFSVKEINGLKDQIRLWITYHQGEL